MRIKKIKSRCRRDFTAIFECESCGNEREIDGYDDDYFHKNVIPDMVCDSCGQKSPHDYTPISPKYHDSQVV